MSDKVIVCGSREGISRIRVGERISELPEGTVIVHGRSPGGGTDDYADFYAREFGYTVITVPINDADRRRARAMSRPKFAPIARNIRMYDEHPDASLVIAFWNGESPGTKQMIDEGRRRGVPVEVDRNGTPEPLAATPSESGAVAGGGTAKEPTA